MSDILNKPDDAGSRWEGPLFLVGMPRSGTKLLRNLLCRHPAIFIPGIETEFLPFLVNWVKKHGQPLDEPSMETLWGELQNSSYFDYRNQDSRPFSMMDWRAACANRFDAAGLFEGFVRHETGCRRGSGAIWGDKSPTYVRHLELIHCEFPAARIVHIVRDARDYCLSIRNAWGKDMRRAAMRWDTDVAAASEFVRSHPDRCTELHYESLIRSTEREMRALCAFLRIDFHTDMLTPDRVTENLGDAKDKFGILTDNTGKFRQHMSQRDLRAIEALAWNSMQRLGYAPEAAKGPEHLGSISLLARKMADGINLVARNVGKRGLLGATRFYINHQLKSRGR